MNLFELHNKPEELDHYDEMDVLQDQSKKIDADPGTQYHNVFGELNRADGPAYILPGRVQVWYKNGLRHRMDGPAKVFRRGMVEYWINGMQYANIIDYEVAGGDPYESI